MKKTKINKPLAALFALMLVLGVGAGNEGTSHTKLALSEFRLIKYRDDGTLDWLLYAEKGVTAGNRIHLQKARIIFYRTPDDKTEVISPQCSFDEAAKRGRSKEKVQIRSPNMTIDGVGFDLDAQKRIIVIRRQVRVKILNSTAKLFAGPAK